MGVTFVDRQSTYPNRYKITREDGTTEYVTLERADEPTVAGTPLNAETFNSLFADLGNAGSENVFLVNVSMGATSSDLVADKTYTEIQEAYAASKVVRLVYMGKEYGIHSKVALKYHFYPVAITSLTVNTLVVGSDDVWYFETVELSPSVVAMTAGGTGATDGATGLKNLFAAGATVLSSHQYGDTLPDPGTPGRIFFKKVT